MLHVVRSGCSFDRVRCGGMRLIREGIYSIKIQTIKRGLRAAVRGHRRGGFYCKVGELEAMQTMVECVLLQGKVEEAVLFYRSARRFLNCS